MCLNRTNALSLGGTPRPARWDVVWSRVSSHMSETAAWDPPPLDDSSPTFERDQVLRRLDKMAPGSTMNVDRYARADQEFQEGDAMIEVQSTRARPGLTASQCVICGKSIRVNPSKYAVKVVCKACRCTHCGIPISFEICRCNESHGRPSRMPGLCERCYVVTHPPVPAVLVDDAVSLEYVSAPFSTSKGYPDQTCSRVTSRHIH